MIPSLTQHRIVFMYLVLQMVYLAAKLWRPEEDKSFKSVLNAVKQFEPSSADLMKLIEVFSEIWLQFLIYQGGNLCSSQIPDP